MICSQPIRTRHPELVSGSIGRFAIPKRRQTQPHRQISPMRVMLVDQVDFPRPVPVLQLLFALDRAFHVAKQFKVNETVDRIFRRMSGHRAIAMLPHAANKVRCHADIQRTVKLASKDVDAGLFFLSHGRSLAAKWTLKQVQGDELFESGFCQRGHPELVSGSIGKFSQKWSYALEAVTNDHF